jgi:transposase InsO family protein
VKKQKLVSDFVLKMKALYREAGKKARGELLDEFLSMTGYSRKHSMAILRGDFKPSTRRGRRRRQPTYSIVDREAIWKLSELFDHIGSKRLRAAMDQELPRLYAAGHLDVGEEGYARLMRVSPSTLDRIRAQRRVPGRRLRGGTKPGSLLKKQIPIRTFADWDDKRCGFVEIDLVQHDGGNSSGIFACTLHVTDVSTGWCEPIAVENKAQKRVFDALLCVRRRLPFQLLGIDSDNGAEFINAELHRYCELNELTFTRGRVGRKNDNAHVEQKNFTVVRKLVGYIRYDTPAQVKLLNALYERYRLYINFFLPVTKLLRKERIGSRVKKIYDAPRTPYQRVLDAPEVNRKRKEALTVTYQHLDVVNLRNEIDALLAKIRT